MVHLKNPERQAIRETRFQTPRRSILLRISAFGHATAPFINVWTCNRREVWSGIELPRVAFRFVSANWINRSPRRAAPLYRCIVYITWIRVRCASAYTLVDADPRISCIWTRPSGRNILPCAMSRAIYVRLCRCAQSSPTYSPRETRNIEMGRGEVRLWFGH